MRVLNQQELAFVCGAEGVCTAEDSGNNFAGVSDTEGLAQDLINIYEASVAAVSYVIERVANAL